MKLFNKFLAALLVSSLIPLIVYSVFLLMTTGTVLKSVVNENNTHVAVNMASEANRFFMDIEKGLDIAREIEKSRVKVSDAQKTALLFTEMQKNSMYYAIYLLDDNFKITSGVSAYDYTATAGIDESIAVKARDFNKVNVGSIGYISSDKPFVDVIYPINTFPREYLYLKVKLKSLMARVDSHRKPDETPTGKQVYIFDDAGAQTYLADKPQPALDAKTMDYLRNKEYEKAFVENKMVNIVMKTRGPEWILVYREPTKEAYAEIYKMFISALVLILLTAGAAFLFATGLAQGLVKPIKTLVSGIEVVAKKGDLDYKLPHVDTAELNQVSDAFNSMTGKLKEMQVVMKQSERLSTIGQMSNILGHEIRNPLAAMTNAIYLIRMELSKLANAKELKVFKRIDIIENEINSTNKIINDMLDFSRTRPPVLFKQDMGEVVKEILEKTKMPDKVTLEQEYNATRKVNVDVEEIKQVVRNLVNNAVDAMADRPVAMLTISTSDVFMRRGEAQVPAVLLEIADTGGGIPDDIMKKIWEPFFSTKSKGTGLGLAVVKRIIEERHKGLMEVRSIVGSGTTFSLKLPAALE